jgi:hypothetical protein
MLKAFHKHVTQNEVNKWEDFNVANPVNKDVDTEKRQAMYV